MDVSKPMLSVKDDSKQQSSQPSNARPPCAVLWSPIPLLTWLLPCIGHIGISDSSGTAYDFAGSGTILRWPSGRTLLGMPTRWLQLVHPEDTGSAAEGTWPSKQALHHDQELNTVADAFKTEPYNLFTNNCHVFVSAVMTHVDYRNTHWDPFKVAVLVFFCARYTSIWGFLHTWLPFMTMVVLGVFYGRMVFLYVWLGLSVSLLAWFIIYNFANKRQWKPSVI